MLGAELIHLESTPRPDGTRLIAGIPATEDQWWERSPIFSALNTNKKSLTLDFQTERGRELLRRLIPTCDVIVENFTPRVIDQLGLDFDSVRALRDDVDHGADARFRARRAVAGQPRVRLHHRGRLRAELAHRLSRTAIPYEPYSVGDPNAGVHALNASAAGARAPASDGRGRCSSRPPWSTRRSTSPPSRSSNTPPTGHCCSATGNRGPAAAPQNLYRTADVDEFGRADCWVAIAVTTNRQWEALRDAIGRPGWAMDPELADDAGRRAQPRPHRRAAGRVVPARARGDEIVETLWAAGVPVAKVMQPHRQTELPQLRHRGFFEHVGHPVNVAASHSTLPVRLSNGPERFHRHARAAAR